jgi:hypothetical protein
MRSIRFCRHTSQQGEVQRACSSGCAARPLLMRATAAAPDATSRNLHVHYIAVRLVALWLPACKAQWPPAILP